MKEIEQKDEPANQQLNQRVTSEHLSKTLSAFFKAIFWVKPLTLEAMMLAITSYKLDPYLQPSLIHLHLPISSKRILASSGGSGQSRERWPYCLQLKPANTKWPIRLSHLHDFPKLRKRNHKKIKITLLPVIPTMTYQDVEYILTFYLTYIYIYIYWHSIWHSIWQSI